jgi:hypothetical protein
MCSLRGDCSWAILHNKGLAVTSLHLTTSAAAAAPAPADVQGSYMCSLRGDCSWAILHNTGMGPISLLRLLRFFRIMWILKHVKFMRISTLLGGLAVRVSMVGAQGGGDWEGPSQSARGTGWQQMLV